MSYRQTLTNGVRVVGEEISAVRSVSLGIWVYTGSRNETVRSNGISHFLEHMLFKGTQRYSARELAEVFDGIGGQVNAFTSKEYTCFYAKVLDQHFAIAAETLAEMLLRSSFAPEEIEKEKNVVIEEIRMYEDTPDELVMDVLASQVYGSHPLGYTILGLEENLRSFSRQDLGSYVKQRYVPQNVVISIAGNVPVAEVLEKLEEQFGARVFPARTADPQVVAPQFIVGSSVKVKETEQVHLCLATPGLAAGDSRLYALVLLNNALGSSSSSRLFQEIREERGMAYSVFSFHSSYRDCGMFGVYAATSPEHVTDTLDLVRKICEDVAVNGLTEAEIRKGKEQVKGSMMLSLESTSSRMSRLGKNELMLGREVSLDESIQGIEQVNVEDVKRVAAAILERPMSLAAVGPVAGLNLDV